MVPERGGEEDQCKSSIINETNSLNYRDSSFTQKIFQHSILVLGRLLNQS